ncbi:MAG: acyl-CoA thioesterase [Bacteroidaceae bacterium]|nr:acyl-CoA thioesterase [Bacteroidaceae bacterium]
MKELKISKEFDIRFSEVDMMNVVWHGSYPVYFEDAREYFGIKTGLTYQSYIKNHVYAPIVEMDVKYKRPLIYGMKPRIDIIYRPTEAAKVIFDYEIHDTKDNTLMATGHTVQVFMDMNYELILQNPEFYLKWKEEMGLI